MEKSIKSKEVKTKEELLDPLAFEDDDDAMKAKKDTWLDIFYSCPEAADQISNKFKELGDKDFNIWVTMDLDDDIHSLELSKKVLSVCFEKENIDDRKVLIKDLIDIIDTLIVTKKYIRDKSKRKA